MLNEQSVIIDAFQSMNEEQAQAISRFVSHELTSHDDLSRQIDEADGHAVALFPRSYHSPSIWAVETISKPTYFRRYDVMQSGNVVWFASNCKAYVENRTETARWAPVCH